MRSGCLVRGICSHNYAKWNKCFASKFECSLAECRFRNVWAGQISNWHQTKCNGLPIRSGRRFDNFTAMKMLNRDKSC